MNDHISYKLFQVEEIDALKSGRGGSSVKIFNGRFLRESCGPFVYIFNLENFLAVLDESPAELEIRRNKYPAQVLLTQGLEVEIGIEKFNGQFIPEAKLITNLWYLYELLKKKYIESGNKSAKVDFRLSEFLFLGRQFISKPLLGMSACENCGTKNTVHTYEPTKRPICSRCKSPLILLRYSSHDPLNKAQKKQLKHLSLRSYVLFGGHRELEKHIQ